MAPRIDFPGGVHDLEHLLTAALSLGRPRAAVAQASSAAQKSNSNSDSTGTDELEDVIDSIDKMVGRAMWHQDCCWYGQEGLMQTLERYTPQMFADAISHWELPGTIVITAPAGELQPGDTYSVTYKHFPAAEEPQQLLELMPFGNAFTRAQHKLLCYMATEDVICKLTLPRWEVFVQAQRQQMQQFEERGDLGGFLAANHKAWMAMWKDGVAPDAFNGLVDLSIWVPAWHQSMGSTVCSSDGGAGSGVGGSGSGAGNSSKPANAGRRRRRHGGRRQGPAT